MKLVFLFEDRLNRNVIKSIVKRKISKIDIFDTLIASKIQDAVEDAVLEVADFINAQRTPAVKYYPYGKNVEGSFSRENGEATIQVAFAPEMLNALEVINAISHEISHYVQWVKSGYRENILDPVGLEDSTGLGLVRFKRKHPNERTFAPYKGSIYGYYSRPEEIMAYAGDAADYFKKRFGHNALEKVKNFNIEDTKASKDKHGWMAYYQIKNVLPSVFKRFLKEVFKNLSV